MLSVAADKVKLFAEIVFENSSLDDSDFFQPAFFSRSNLKLHNIHVTPQDGYEDYNRSCFLKGFIFSALFLHISVIDGIDGMFLQNCSVNSGVPRNTILGIILFLLCINDRRHVISNIPVNVYDTTLHRIRLGS